VGKKKVNAVGFFFPSLFMRSEGKRGEKKRERRVSREFPVFPLTSDSSALWEGGEGKKREGRGGGGRWHPPPSLFCRAMSEERKKERGVVEEERGGGANTMNTTLPPLISYLMCPFGGGKKKKGLLRKEKGRTDVCATSLELLSAFDVFRRKKRKKGHCRKKKKREKTVLRYQSSLCTISLHALARAQFPKEEREGKAQKKKRKKGKKKEPAERIS